MACHSWTSQSISVSSASFDIEIQLDEERHKRKNYLIAMHLLTTLVTIAALLAHAGLGCCAHHAHSAETSTLEADDCCCCASEAEEGHCDVDRKAMTREASEFTDTRLDDVQAGMTGAPAPVKHCSESYCGFIGLVKSNVPFDFAKHTQAISPIGLAAIPMMAPSTAVPRCGKPGAPNGRLYLFYQILLI